MPKRSPELFLMRKILGVTHDLSQALQREDQDIVNAMRLVSFTQELLNSLRNDYYQWEYFMEDILVFCEKHDIDTVDMDGLFFLPGKSRRRMTKNAVTNLHHYHVEIFNTVIDRVLLELNERFSETSTELLLCVSCLDPRDNFAAFDKKKLLRLAELYPSDFSEIERELLAVQLDIYILDMRSSPEFSKVNGISGLLKKLVVLRRHNQYVWVFKLLKFACLLPVATASVERVFSAMKIIKNRLRNKIGDGFVSDCLITFIERDVVATISNETIMERFQNMHTRRISNK